jgi:hypothetical protein
MRDGGLDGEAERLEIIGQLVGAQRGLDRHHAAADIDPHGGRDDRLAARDHAADGGALAGVDVGHHGDPLVNERQGGDAAELVLGLGFERDAVGPGLDRHVLGGENLVGELVVGGHGETRRAAGGPGARAFDVR